MEVTSLKTGEWSCYRGGQFNGHVTEVVTLMEGERSCQRVRVVSLMEGE